MNYDTKSTFVYHLQINIGINTMINNNGLQSNIYLP